MAEKTTLDLSEYQPYIKMGQSCQLKDIDEFQVNWPKLATANNLKKNNLMMRYMGENDIDEVVALWKIVYPEAYGSTHQFVFNPQWYGGNVLFDENWEAVPGTWIIEVWQGEKKLVSQEFNVVKMKLAN